MTDDGAVDRLLDAGAIEQFVTEVADALPEIRDRRVVVVVGGALLAWRGLREATQDVDSRAAHRGRARRRSPRPRAEVAQRQRSRVRPGDVVEEDCDVLPDHPALLVLGAPLEQVFVMKLFAGRAADTADLETLWPRCGFASPEAAAEAFHAAYPHLERDPHLANWIRGLGHTA